MKNNNDVLQEWFSEAGKFWYITVANGLIMLLLGVWILMTPMQSFLALAVLFSISFIISGALKVYVSITSKRNAGPWGWFLALGILDLITGAILVSHPQISIITLPLIVGFSVLFQSIWAIIWSFDLKDYGESNWGLLLFVGILGVLFAFILMAKPVFAGLTLVAWTGMSFLTLGFLYTYAGFKIKSLRSSK